MISSSIYYFLTGPISKYSDIGGQGFKKLLLENTLIQSIKLRMKCKDKERSNTCGTELQLQ